MWHENPKVAQYTRQGYEAWQLGNLTEAMTAYENALMLKPKDTQALNFLGVIYEEMGLPDKAEEKYLTAIKIDRDFLPAYFNLGAFYWNQGNTQKALYYFQKRVQLGDPKDSWTIQAQKALSNIQNNQNAQQMNQDMADHDQDRIRQGLIYRTLARMERQEESNSKMRFSGNNNE